MEFQCGQQGLGYQRHRFDEIRADEIVNAFPESSYVLDCAASDIIGGPIAEGLLAPTRGRMIKPCVKPYSSCSWRQAYYS